MMRKVKALLDGVGLLKPLRRVRHKFFPVPAADPHAGYIAHAQKLGLTVNFTDSYIAVRQGPREIRVSSNHEVYLWDMMNFFDYYHNAVYPRLDEGIAVVDYSRPSLHRLKLSGVEFEFPSLPESDESTETYITTLNVQAGDVVLDLGAYAGASAYFLSQAVGERGRIVSFEPDEINFPFLESNIARHHLTNVLAVKKGVWSETTSLEFQTEGNMGSSAVSVMGRTSNVKRVEVLSLDDAALLAGGSRVAAIKMDIEGAELAVLRSAGDFLQRHRPRLIVEPHVVGGIMSTEEICSLLVSYNYTVELLSQGVQNWPLVAARPKEA